MNQGMVIVVDNDIRDMCDDSNDDDDDELRSLSTFISNIMNTPTDQRNTMSQESLSSERTHGSQLSLRIPGTSATSHRWYD